MESMHTFTVSIPGELAAALDRRLAKGDENRSRVIHRLIEQALFEDEERDEIDRYIQGYRVPSQTGEILSWADRAAAEQRKPFQA